MSDRWWISVSGRRQQGGRNDIPIALLTVYREQDKYSDERWLLAHQVLDSGGFEDDVIIASEEYLETADTEAAFGYCAPAKAVVARLNLMGFTASACRREIVSALREMAEGDLIEIAYRNQDGEHTSTELAPEEVLHRALGALERQLTEVGGRRKLDPIDIECLWQLENCIESDMDPRILLAVQLVEADLEAPVKLDLHDLYAAGYFNDVEEIATLATEGMAEQVGSTGPVIVVTEGVSDSRFLRRALELCAPEICDVFRFLDPDSRPEGGAVQVIRTIRSFSAAGVMNRTVAILDNDAAGHAALAQLGDTQLLPHIRAITLPDVPYAHSYPTYGPDGLRSHELNGGAVTIELQFGLSALVGPDGAPVPVRWTNYERRVDRYQGELLNKQYVQANIERLLSGPPADIEEDALTAMGRMVEAVVSAAIPARFPTQAF